MPVIEKRDDTPGALSALSLSRRTLGSSSGRGAFEHRRHRAARTAPWRPDVDEHRDIVVRHVTAETLLVDLDRMAAEYRLVAGAAASRRRTRARPAAG